MAAQQNETKKVHTKVRMPKEGPDEAILLIMPQLSTDKNLVLGRVEKGKKWTEKKRRKMKQSEGKWGVGLLHHGQMVKESWEPDVCLSVYTE